MRSAISTLLVLTLAINGLACACPADNAVATENESHAQHNGHQASAQAENCHGDECGSDCDELTASKTQRQSAALPAPVIEPEPEDEPQVVSTTRRESFWPTGSALHVLLYFYNRYCADVSPVSLKDRMQH